MKDHKATILAVNAAFEQGSVEDVLQLCTSDIAWTMVGMGTWNGAETIRANWASMMGEGSALPKITVDRMIVDDANGMGDGVVTTKRKDGTEMTVYYCDTYRFDDRGKITEMKSYCIDEKTFSAHETALTAGSTN